MVNGYSMTVLTLLSVTFCYYKIMPEAMSQRIGINPRLRTNYIRPNTIRAGASVTRAAALSAGEMRRTLSVAAALLTTLAFVAGFSLPGGLNQETDEALLPKKASFLVFILAYTYAMCCSMLVLFCLMWSMVCDQDRAILLVDDRSVLILVQALYGMLLAFMTGVFTVISRKSLWASILAFFMCSLVAASANKTVLYKILDKLAPSAIRDNRKQT
ncbi:Ankyrin repeat-containing protein ITN1 [Bienertia sinuspersici]